MSMPDESLAVRSGPDYVEAQVARGTAIIGLGNHKVRILPRTQVLGES